MHRLAVVADDHILHETPHDVIENRDAEKREAIRPRYEDRSEDDERDAGLAVAILLEIELIVSARGAANDDCFVRRRYDVIGCAAAFARPRYLARFAREARVTFWTEKVD